MATGAGHAFGKLILFGEHAVVYGAPAIACGIDRGLQASLVSTDATESELWLLDERRTSSDEDLLAQAFRALLEAGSGRPAANVSIRVVGDLPPGMNLGFSAAAAVAIARTLEATDETRYVARVDARADAWERVFHGNPSGIDVAAALYGGFVWFRRGHSVRQFGAHSPLRLCVGLSGAKPSPTKVMVESVAALRASQPDAFHASLEAIVAIVERAQGALAEGDLVTLGELMDLNQLVLAGWMLSTVALERLCELARERGALGAKLTGAGGGGAMVALAGAASDPASRTVATRIIEAWATEGFQGFEVVVGEPRG